MDKIKRFLLYIFGLFFIISSIQFYEKGQFGALLFMVLFGLSFFPVVYDNIKEKIPNLKLKYYVICSLSLFIICVILGAIGDEKVRVVKEEMENKTKMEVLLDESITTEDKIELIIKTSEIKELTINDKKEEIKDGEKKIILDLKDGENTIKIVGKNGEIIREFNQTIKKVTKEDLEKAKKEEKEKIEAEIKDFIIKSKDLIEQGSKGHFKTVEEQIQNNNSYIERY
ncbi:hypothetical protein DLH72_00870, partial [Candidatus Gracilibacteria bacterium]